MLSDDGELFVQVRQHNKKMRKKASVVTQRKKSKFLSLVTLYFNVIFGPHCYFVFGFQRAHGP